MVPQISIVVPVYKAEKYLHRCLDSILAQTFKDFELILVDDGSPDNCGAICDEYAANDSRVHVFHKENGGVTAARADGVKYSIGEWITFVDADDTLPQDALNIYVDNISDDINIIRGPFNSFGPEEERIYINTVLTSQEYRGETINSNFLYTAPWGALIKRTLFSSEVFNIPRTIVFGEDYIMHIRLAFANNKKVRIISQPVYNYIQHKDSCANTFMQSHDYTVKWYHCIYNSIPEQDRDNYIYECINFRLRRIYLLRKYYVFNNIWKMDTFHKDLLHDIKRSNYKLSNVKKITLHFSSPITNGIYLIILDVFNKTKKFCQKIFY